MDTLPPYMYMSCVYSYCGGKKRGLDLCVTRIELEIVLIHLELRFSGRAPTSGLNH